MTITKSLLLGTGLRWKLNQESVNQSIPACKSSVPIVAPSSGHLP